MCVMPHTGSAYITLPRNPILGRFVCFWSTEPHENNKLIFRCLYPFFIRFTKDESR